MKLCVVCKKNYIEDYEEVCNECFDVYHAEQVKENEFELIEGGLK